MLIEEESQFECDGVYETDSQIGQRCTLNKISKHQSGSNTAHIIIAAEPLSSQAFFAILWGRLPSFIESGIASIRNLMITLLQSERLKCVQNQKAKRFYREGGQIKNESEHIITELPYIGFSNQTIEARKSIGDDAEDFFQRMVKDQIVPNDLDINRPFIGQWDAFFFDLWPKTLWVTKTYWKKTQYVHTFHLPMLSEEEENYLNSSEASLDTHFKFKTILQQKEMNFALSVCLRKTFLLQGEILYGIKEPEPWQAKIMKNFQDDPPPKKFTINPYEYKSL